MFEYRGRQFTAYFGKVIKEKTDLVNGLDNPEPVALLSMRAGKKTDRCAVTARLARSLRN